MQVKIALLADSANISREGKLNILGVFDTIYTHQFPTTHPHMHLVLRFSASPQEAGRACALEVQLVAQDGRVVFGITGSLGVPHVEPGEMVGVDHVLAFANLVFAEAGRYAFRITVDGVEAASVPLRVESMPVKH
jgi:hypothetical protein